MSTPSYKYDSFRDSALHFLCNAGWGNESDGDAPDYGSHFTRISLNWSDVGLNNTEFNSLIEQWENHEEAHGMEYHRFRASLVGHWLVSEDNQGFVHVRGFTREDQAKARFDAFAGHYAQWLDSDGGSQ